MKYKVEYSKSALKDLKKMDKYTQTMLLTWIKKNISDLSDPRVTGKELKGNLKGLWRYRAGNYRILCHIEDEKLIILVINIGHRKEIYK